MINDDIEIIVLGLKGNQVRLGINAPDSVAVHREEIYLKIQGEKIEKDQCKVIYKRPILREVV